MGEKSFREVAEESWDEAAENPELDNHLGYVIEGEAVEVTGEDGKTEDDESSETENEDTSEDTESEDDEDTGTDDEDEDQSSSEEDDEDQETRLEAPAQWSSEDREMFAGLDESAQEFLLRRHKSMEGDYTRKTQEAAEAIKTAAVVDDYWTGEIAAEMNRLGVDKPGLVKQLLGWHHLSATNPTRFAQELMTMLRLDPAQVFNLKKGDSEETEETKDDPNENRLAAIEQNVAQINETRHQQLVQQAQDKVREFANEKDDSGNLIHPHFEAVRVQMGKLVTTDKSVTMEQAYAAACAMAGLDGRETQSAGDTTEDANAQDGENPSVNKKERLRKARQAVKSNVRGGSSSGTGLPNSKDGAPMSLREAAAAAAEEIGMT